MEIQLDSIDRFDVRMPGLLDYPNGPTDADHAAARRNFVQQRDFIIRSAIWFIIAVLIALLMLALFVTNFAYKFGI